MTTIYLELNGIGLQVLNIKKFQLLNWVNFKINDPVYIDGVYFADFLTMEESAYYNDIIVKLKRK